MKRLAIVLTCFLLCLLVACGGSEQESSSIDSSVSVASSPESSKSEASSVSESSEPSESSAESEPEKEKPVVVSSDAFVFPNVDFPEYDPSSEMTYDEYFSEERYLIDTMTTEKKGDIPGYKYVRGAETDESVWNDGPRYWTHPYDNLYLYRGSTGERTLLAEVEGISRLMIFPDCLYLITDNAVWRCGRLGENLTCVYEHPTAFYVTDSNCFKEVIFFEADGEIWRLHVPSGTADQLCVIDDLPAYDKAEIGYIPCTNYAFFTFPGNEIYVFSSRTGEETKLDVEHSWSDNFDEWVASFYELNRY